MPYFSFVQQIRPGGSAVLDEMLVGCAVKSWKLSIKNSPGRASAMCSAECVTTGQYTSPSGITLPAALTPQEFNAFRDNLNPASGFQSIQFREIEFLCGLRRTETLAHIVMDDAQRARLHALLEAPSLYDHVKALLARRGFASEAGAPLIESLRVIYTNAEANYDLYLLLEDLIEFDERFLLWRGRHVRMVERMIGQRTGTGGSSGAQYLQGTLVHRFFPELWDVRSYLGKGSYA